MRLFLALRALKSRRGAGHQPKAVESEPTRVSRAYLHLETAFESRVPSCREPREVTHGMEHIVVLLAPSRQHMLSQGSKH